MTSRPTANEAALAAARMGVRTLFNILGPLTNPAGAPHILMGVFHPDLVGIQVRVLQRLGARNALVVWGRENRVVPLACGEAYARAMPNARLVQVDGAGLWVDLEQPDALARLIEGHRA